MSSLRQFIELQTRVEVLERDLASLIVEVRNLAPYAKVQQTELPRRGPGRPRKDNGEAPEAA